MDAFEEKLSSRCRPKDGLAFVKAEQSHSRDFANQSKYLCHFEDRRHRSIDEQHLFDSLTL
jgi:hypothetical protein